MRTLSPWGAFVSHQIQSDTHQGPARSGFILRPGALDISFLLQPFLSEVKKKKRIKENLHPHLSGCSCIIAWAWGLGGSDEGGWPNREGGVSWLWNPDLGSGCIVGSKKQGICMSKPTGKMTQMELL